MFKINKTELDYFKQAKAKVKLPKQKTAWQNKHISEIRADLRRDILVNEQQSLCVYCEKQITAKPTQSNIDHFKTRHQFPQLTLDYDNLLVSCNHHQHCSHTKDNFGLNQSDYDNLINPVTEHPNYFFDYSFAGDIIAKSNLNRMDAKKANFTIQVFNLNNKSLIEERKKIIQSLQICTHLSLDEILVYFNGFISLSHHIYPKLQH